MIKKIKKSTFRQVFFLCLLATFAWGFNLFFHPGPASSDAATYASTARNIIRGHGFTAPLTAPLFLPYRLPLSEFGWPSYYSHLYPLFLAVFFFILGPYDLTIALTNGFLFVLTIPFLYLLAKKIFSWQVACLSCLWYIFTPGIIDYSSWGFSEPLYIFLIVLGVFLLFVHKKIFWSGVVFALASLTKYQGIIFVFPLTIFIYKYKGQKSRLATLQFIFGFLLILVLKKLLLPPLATDYASFENNLTWTVLAEGAIFPTNPYAGLILEPITFNQIITNLNLLAWKVLTNFYSFIQNLFTFALPPVTVLYLLSFFKTDPSKEAKSFKFLCVTLISVFLLFHLLTVFSPRYFLPFIPLISIYAAGILLAFFNELNPRKSFRLAILFSFLFIIIPSFTYNLWGTSFLRGLAWPRKPTINQIVGKIAKDNISPESIVVATNADAIAWYAERRVIRIPRTLAELNKIDREYIPIDAILLTFYDPKPAYEPELQSLIDNPHDFGSFYLAKKIEIKAEENYYQTPLKIVLYLKKII